MILRRRDSKQAAKRVPSNFAKIHKLNEGVRSDGDVHSSMDGACPPQMNMKAPIVFDPLEAEDFFSEDLMQPFDDENFMLDTTQDLPLRKPQSAYVIFGKLVRFRPQ